jgi:hypothetical protein
MIYDAGAFHEELVAAGLKIHGVGSDGSIAWNGVPTQMNLDVADAVRRAHDPGKREREEKDRRVDLDIVATRLWNASKTMNDWGGLDAASRLEVVRQAVRAVAVMLRRMG